MSFLTALSDFYYSGSYLCSIANEGYSRIPGLDIAGRASLVGLSMLGTAVGTWQILESKSKLGKVGYGLLLAGSMVAVSAIGVITFEESLRKGCEQIILRYGDSIPSYSPCRDMLCTLTIKVIKG